MCLVVGGERKMLLKRILRKSSSEQNQSQKRLSPQEKHLMKLEAKAKKRKAKRIQKARKKYNQRKKEYIKFLKANNMWSEDLERKYNPGKDKPHDLEMNSFDEDYAIRLARASVYKKNSKISKKKNKYGDDKKKDYYFYIELLAITEEICRVNKWTTKKEMEDHGVPVDKYMKLFIQAATAYAEIKKYYAKQDYDIRRDQHMGL